MERKHVFVVNSAPEFLDLMRELLQQEQYNVTTTNVVPKTFDQIAALNPDLLVIDVRVGEEAGWDLLERLHDQATTNRIPVIIVSTSPRLLEETKAEQRFGGEHFLIKPFDLDELLAAIQDLIGVA